MANLIKREIYPSGMGVEMYDKTMKTNVDYNYLVEVSVNGRTSHESKTFATEAEADTYYDSMVAKYNTI